MNRSSHFLPDDPDALREALFDRARRDEPSPQARQRMLTNVAAASVVTTGAGLIAASVANQGTTASGAAVSAAKVGSLVVAKWALSGALAATAVLGVREAAVHYYEAANAPELRTNAPTGMRATVTRRDHEVRTAVVPPSSSAVSAVAPGLAESPPPRAPDVAISISAPAKPAPPPAVSRAVASADRETNHEQQGPSNSATPLAHSASDVPVIAPRQDSATPQLLRELAFLEKARGYLAHQAPFASLDVLGDYERMFPAGTLKIEAWALRIEATAAAGRRTEAVSMARNFLTSHPQHPMANRVRTLLSNLETPPGR
jgi:hypothetical protein